MCASQRIVKGHYRTGVPLAAGPPVIAWVRWALAVKLPVAPARSLPLRGGPTTSYFVRGDPPQTTFRFVPEDNSSLTYEKEK